jgi:dihydroorotate dehydrogenase
LDIYKALVGHFLFTLGKTDPEWLHKQTISSLNWLAKTSYYPANNCLNHLLYQSLSLQHPRLEQTILGMKFPNPLGLAAGFDKDGVGASLWHNFGFGFAELGTVTYHSQPGNPPPSVISFTLGSSST